MRHTSHFFFICCFCFNTFQGWTPKRSRKSKTCEQNLLERFKDDDNKEKEGTGNYFVAVSLIFFTFVLIVSLFPLRCYCFLICCVSLVLISLRSSPRQLLMLDLLLLDHMRWSDNDTLLHETRTHLFAAREKMGYVIYLQLGCVTTDEPCHKHNIQPLVWVQL